jgi:hypothetical protein
MGFSENEPDLNWVYNSSTQILKVETELNQGILRAYGMNGELLLKQPISLGVSSVDLSQFARGIYLIQISTDSHTLETIKIVR